MIILFFFKRILRQLYFQFKEILSLARLQKRYPSCVFHSGSKISNSTFGKYNVIFNNVSMNSCTLGNHTYIQKNTTVFNTEIGKYCSIASGVSIGPGIHKIDGVSTHPVFYLNNTPLAKKFSDQDLFVTSKRTIIGHDVWIGEKSIILDGVTIGTGAIIAGGAVVTKDVLPYSIVGGIPAKEIKFRFEKKEINLILNSCWWDYPDDWLIKNYRSFNNVSEFLQKINKNDSLL